MDKWLLNPMLLSPTAGEGGGASSEGSAADTNSNQGGTADEGSGGSDESAPPTDDGQPITDHDAGDEHTADAGDATDEAPGEEPATEGEDSKQSAEAEDEDEAEVVDDADLRRWALGALADQEETVAAGGQQPQGQHQQQAKPEPEPEASPLIDDKVVEDLLREVPEVKPLADAFKALNKELTGVKQFIAQAQQAQVRAEVEDTHRIIDRITKGDPRFGNSRRGMSQNDVRYRVQLDATAAALFKRASLEGRQLTKEAAIVGAYKLMPKKDAQKPAAPAQRRAQVPNRPAVSQRPVAGAARPSNDKSAADRDFERAVKRHAGSGV